MVERRELHRRATAWSGDLDPVPRTEHLERDEDPEAARTYIAAARSQTAEYRRELALRLIERSLSLATDRTDAQTWRCAFGTISRITPCRKKGVRGEFARKDVSANQMRQQ
jgi:hypothetical protein